MMTCEILYRDMFSVSLSTSALGHTPVNSHGRMLTVFCLVSLTAGVRALLYPRDSPTRSSKSLDGVWSLKLTPKADQDAGFRESWFSKPLDGLGKWTISQGYEFGKLLMKKK